jgi:hypothetical protein
MGVKLLTPPLHYRTLEDFFSEVPDVDRRLSPSVSFGDGWTEPNERGWTWPRSQLRWFRRTGELIVVRHHRFSRRDTVKVIAVIEGRAEIERILDGWAVHCGSEGLGWVYDRLAATCRKHETETSV